MMGVKKSSSIFRRRVRNQVLEKNQRSKCELNFYVFGMMNPHNYNFLYDIYIDRGQKNVESGRACRTVLFYGPGDHSWEENTEYCLFEDLDPEYCKPTIVLPRIWLFQYDPTIPIFLNHNCNKVHYLNLEKRKYIPSLVYLIRDRFRTIEQYHYPLAGALKPYSIGKGDEDWCATHINYYPSALRFYFRSFVLLKNIDFTEFDTKVEAEGLKCPVPYSKGIKVKDKPQFRIVSRNPHTWKGVCICINCRKDYRAFGVNVYLGENIIKCNIIDPI